MDKTKALAKAGELIEQYNEFKTEWLRTHTISPAPSFTSWKKNYRNQ